MHKKNRLSINLKKIVKTKVLFLVALFAVSTAAKAQQNSDEATKNVTDGVLATADADAAEGWSKGVVLGLNMGQVALSNWQGGGQSSISVTSLLSLFRNYKQETLFRCRNWSRKFYSPD